MFLHCALSVAHFSPPEYGGTHSKCSQHGGIPFWGRHVCVPGRVSLFISVWIPSTHGQVRTQSQHSTWCVWAGKGAEACCLATQAPDEGGGWAEKDGTRGGSLSQSRAQQHRRDSTKGNRRGQPSPATGLGALTEPGYRAGGPAGLRALPGPGPDFLPQPVSP